jgi:hypothetical protein
MAAPELIGRGSLMKLRDHPLISFKGVRSWPPVWFDAELVPGKMIKGEVGILTDVVMRELELCRVFLTIRYQGGSFIGVLFFDDQPFCLKVYKFLKACIGKEIKNIGDMEFQ